MNGIEEDFQKELADKELHGSGFENRYQEISSRITECVMGFLRKKRKAEKRKIEEELEEKRPSKKCDSFCNY